MSNTVVIVEPSDVTEIEVVVEPAVVSETIVQVEPPVSETIVQIEPPDVTEIVVEVTEGRGPEGPVGPPGPKGDRGDPGPQGTPGDASVEFSFPVASTEWVCQHNLGYREANVDATDSYGRRIEGDITYIDNTTLTITWFYPTTGHVRVSV